MSVPIRGFKRIERTEDETVTLTVSAPIVAKLDTLAQKLTEDFGFDVTVANAIGWLVRQHESVAVTVEEQARRAVVAAEDASARAATADMDREAEEWMRLGNKIMAIKHVRERSRMGLKEAKDYVEHKWNHVLPPR